MPILYVSIFNLKINITDSLSKNSFVITTEFGVFGDLEGSSAENENSLSGIGCEGTACGGVAGSTIGSVTILTTFMGSGF